MSEISDEKLIEHRRAMDVLGFTVIRQLADMAVIDEALSAVQPLVAEQKQSLDTVSFAGGYVDALANLAKSTLRRMQYATVVPLGPVLINKKPGEQSRGWHWDWRWWNLPLSMEPAAGQIGVIFYFRDTNINNGCLRVIPGTHVSRTMDALWLQGSVEKTPYGMDVTANKGDAVLIDSRLLHGTSPNNSDENREAVNLWYQVDLFDDRMPTKCSPYQ